MSTSRFANGWSRGLMEKWKMINKYSCEKFMTKGILKICALHNISCVGNLSIQQCALLFSNNMNHGESLFYLTTVEVPWTQRSWPRTLQSWFQNNACLFAGGWRSRHDIFLLSNKLLNSLTISMIQKTVRELHLIERPDWTFFLFGWKPIKI